MTMSIFSELSILFGITAAICFAVRLLRQPLIIAYLIAGIVGGPVALNVFGQNEEVYRVFSEFGVVLLLFMVGLSLNFNYIKKIARVSVIAGLAQMFGTTIIGFFLLRFLDFALWPALYVSMAITFSSTIIITKLLSDKRDSDSVYGRYTIGLMLVQDVIAIAIMLFITSSRAEAFWLNSVPALLAKGAFLIGGVYVLSRYVLPRLLDRIASSSEFLFVFATAWCLGLASLIRTAGFSLEIGAVMAGISLGSSVYQTEITSRVRPLRDFFLVLFFIVLGGQMTLTNFSAALLPAVLIALFILVGKPFILYFLFRFCGFTRRNSFLAGVTAAQVSEFGFVLLFLGQQAGVIGEREFVTFTLVAIITIFCSSYLISFNEGLYRRLMPFFKLFGKDRYRQTEQKLPIFSVWVIGYHRIGWRVCEALKEKNISFAVIDFNPAVIKQLHHRGVKAYFGDVADVEFLAEVPLEKARLIISTIPEVDDQITLIKHVRGLSGKPQIIASVTETHLIPSLYAAGANYVMMPHLLGGSWIAELLRGPAVTERGLKKLRHEQHQDLTVHFPAAI